MLKGLKYIVETLKKTVLLDRSLIRPILAIDQFPGTKTSDLKKVEDQP
jgi:hypothetical protein